MRPESPVPEPVRAKDPTSTDPRRPAQPVRTHGLTPLTLTKAAAEFWDPTGLPSPLPSHGWYQQALFRGARPVLITPLACSYATCMIGRVRNFGVYSAHGRSVWRPAIRRQPGNDQPEHEHGAPSVAQEPHDDVVGRRACGRVSPSDSTRLGDDTDDGLSGKEGTFLICSFWLVSALTMVGEMQRATDLMERLLVDDADGFSDVVFDATRREQTFTTTTTTG